MNETFYATDMTARGFCDEWAGCEAFSPSSATLKVRPYLQVAASCAAHHTHSVDFPCLLVFMARAQSDRPQKGGSWIHDTKGSRKILLPVELESPAHNSEK